MIAKIFVTDLDEKSREQLKAKLQQEGFQVEVESDPERINKGAQVHAFPKASTLSVVSSSSFHQGSLEVGYTELKKKWCDSFEKDYLMKILNKTGGNVSAAAREAKLDRSNFLRLLRRHGIKAQEFRKEDHHSEELKVA